MLGYEVRSAVSPHDEDGTRVPAISIGRKTNNNYQRNKAPVYGRQNNNSKNPQAAKNTKSSNIPIPKKSVRYNEPKRPAASQPQSRGVMGRRKMSLPEGSLSHFNSRKSSSLPKQGSRGLLREIVSVDHVSPGLHGEELYLYIQGRLNTVNKPENQPLVIEPNNVNFSPSKLAEVQLASSGEDDEEEKELWEKLCDENKIKITFDPVTWEVVEIVGLGEGDDRETFRSPIQMDEDDYEDDDDLDEFQSEEEDLKPNDHLLPKVNQVKAVRPGGSIEKKPIKPKSPLLWARGQAPPKRGVRNNNAAKAKGGVVSSIPNGNKGTNAKAPANNANNNGNGKPAAGVPAKDRNNSKNGKPVKEEQSEPNAEDVVYSGSRRGSLPSVRVMQSPKMTGEGRRSAESESVDEKENANIKSDSKVVEETDLKQRVDRLEEMNLLLIQQLEEARNKIKALEKNASTQQ